MNLFYDKFSGYTSKDLVSGFSLYSLSFDAYSQNFIWESEIAIIPLAVINEEDKRSFSMDKITNKIAQELLSFMSGKIVYYPDGNGDFTQCLFIMINNGFKGDSPGRAEFIGHYQSGHCIFCLCEKKDYLNTISGQVENDFYSLKLNDKCTNILNEFHSLPQDDQSAYFNFIQSHSMNYFSSFYLLPGTSLLEKQELDFMHCEIIGWVKRIDNLLYIIF